MSRETLTTDIVIIGAGPAGCMAGTTLTQQGWSVIGLERSYFPRHVIGESLLPRVNELLAQVGLLPAIKQRHYMPKNGAVFLRGDDRERFCFAEALKGDYPSTFQVPRSDFDQTLATEARRQGFDLRFGHTVTQIELHDHLVQVDATQESTKTNLTLKAKFLLDCSGYGRVLPRLLDLEVPSPLPPRVACFTQFEGDTRPQEDQEGDIWVCVHPENGWIWVIPFSNGRTSVGLVCDASYWNNLTGSPQEKLQTFIAQEPNTSTRLNKAVPVQSTQVIKSFSKKVKQMHGERWALAGNTADFLDPVFSSGVALALESAYLAAQLTTRTLHNETVDWDTEYTSVIHQATNVYRAFIESWYSRELEAIFFSTMKPVRIKRRITSILGGYALRTDNPIAQDTHASLRQLYELVK